MLHVCIVYVHAQVKKKLVTRNLCRITLTSCVHRRPSQKFEIGTTWSSVAGSERAYTPIDWPGSLNHLFSCKLDRIHKHIHIYVCTEVSPHGHVCYAVPIPPDYAALTKH